MNFLIGGTMSKCAKCGGESKKLTLQDGSMIPCECRVDEMLTEYLGPRLSRAPILTSSALTALMGGAMFLSWRRTR